MLPASNGFARMSLPVTNRYNLPVDGFVAFDVETANEQPYSICSISAVKVQGSSIVDVITSLIKPPETRFTNTSIHGITWEKVRNAPTFKEYYESTLHDFIKGYVLVAHNAQFDMGCLLHVAEAEGISLDKPLLFADSLQSARYVYRDLRTINWIRYADILASTWIITTLYPMLEHAQELCGIPFKKVHPPSSSHSSAHLKSYLSKTSCAEQG